MLIRWEKGVSAMLCLGFVQGEYVTIGSEIVVKVQSVEGKRAFLSIEAPKDLSIVRGTVLERNGGVRPSCVDMAFRRK